MFNMDIILRTKQDVVDCIMECDNIDCKNQSGKIQGKAFAPINIALIKYWGKRDEELHLPYNSSLSYSLDRFGTTTLIELANNDEIYFNEILLSNESQFFTKVFQYIDLFRENKQPKLKIITHNNMPTATGFASSSSGFAALVLALNDLFNWNLSKEKLSILARLGSGSACRSLYSRFSLWNAGVDENGMDSFASYLVGHSIFNSMQIEPVIISTKEKNISSREGMKTTVDKSILYEYWIKIAEQNLKDITRTIEDGDFKSFGEIAEYNALLMHATARFSNPNIYYFTDETIDFIKRVQDLRKSGVSIYCTIDAGPNIFVIFLERDRQYFKTILV